MRTNRQIQALHRVILLFVMTALLFALLVPHITDHHEAALAFVLFVPMFLFGTVVVQSSQWPKVLARDEILCSAPVRRSLFQRPPPSLFA
jgi:cytochrome bd-type quinol oxidase subunit 2